jgi:hypothetical protein
LLSPCRLNCEETLRSSRWPEVHARARRRGYHCRGAATLDSPTRQPWRSLGRRRLALVVRDRIETRRSRTRRVLLRERFGLPDRGFRCHGCGLLWGSAGGALRDLQGNRPAPGRHQSREMRGYGVHGHHAHLLLHEKQRVGCRLRAPRLPDALGELLPADPVLPSVGLSISRSRTVYFEQIISAGTPGARRPSRPATARWPSRPAGP